jgi:hypothetical protein
MNKRPKGDVDEEEEQELRREERERGGKPEMRREPTSGAVQSGG